jgi:hypothetical protein
MLLSGNEQYGKQDSNYDIWQENVADISVLSKVNEAVIYDDDLCI